jgi:hypothetical protein
MTSSLCHTQVKRVQTKILVWCVLHNIFLHGVNKIHVKYKHVCIMCFTYVMTQELLTKTVKNGTVKFRLETKQHESMERPETHLRLCCIS